MQKEKWKRFISNKNYLVSSWGRVFSIRSNKILTPNIHQSRSSKYLRIEIGGEKWMLHILVGMHFQKKQFELLRSVNPASSIQCNHKDRNTLNPNNNNLEWTTESENKIHAHQTSTITFGGKTYKGKLNA